MLSYCDSEVRRFHPICESAAKDALKKLGLSTVYEVKHHMFTGSLEMDFVVVNKTTGKYLCVIEVKRTPSDVQSTRYQFQAQSYVQMNMANNEQPFYVVTNLEKLISFRYDPSKSSVRQQMLEPGLENICDFAADDEKAITRKLSVVFKRLFDNFKNNQYKELTTLDDFISRMRNQSANNRQWKSNMAVLMYEYIRGAFHTVHKPEPTITYNVSRFAGDVKQICNEANRVDFDGIFSYNTGDFIPKLVLNSGLLSDIYNYGKNNISGDSIADALHDIVSAKNRHEGEVATDLELANLTSTVAKMVSGDIKKGKSVCDPAAGSGNLISSAIRIFSLDADQIIANDINPQLIELLSLRLGLNYPTTISKGCSPTVTTRDICSFYPNDFNDIDVVLLNPPFVAGINCSGRKVPFYNKIKSIKGTAGITEVGQQNLGAVFLETICCLVSNGTTIACIFPKAQLAERGAEAVAFRKLLLSTFGLQCIVNYPGTGLFESVTEETCILVGKKTQVSQNIKVYSSDVPVADIDLHALETYADGYSASQFESITSDVEAREFTLNSLTASIANGWRMINSEMAESILFVDNNIIKNPKIDLVTNTTNTYRRGNVGGNGGNDLMFFDSLQMLYDKYAANVILEEGIRNAKNDNFVLNNGDSKFLNFNNVPAALSNQIITDFILQSRPAGRQQRKSKSVQEWLQIAKKDGKIKFPANSVLIPTKTRRTGRAHVTDLPLYASTNFMVFSYHSKTDALLIGSYASTIFFQLECEISSKNHAGLRKTEEHVAVTLHVPKISSLSSSDTNKVLANIRTVSFKDLNDPIISTMDEIWAEILFESDASKKLSEAVRLLRFLANRRNNK